MARVIVIDGVDVSSRIEMGTISELTTAARGGERGGGQVTITDPSGELDLKGWHTITIDEDLCIGRPRMFTGRIGGKEIKRGPEGPIGEGRVWQCDLEDVNALAHLRPVFGAPAKRGQEMGLDRVAWLLATLAVGGSFSDTGYVNDTFDRLFDEADYRSNYPDEVLDDITGVRGRDWFIFWDYDAEAVALFYNYRDIAVLESSLKISNIEGADSDPDVVLTGSAAGDDDAGISRQHDEVYAGVLFRWKSGDHFEVLPSTADTFFHETPWRVAVVENSRVGRFETAVAMSQDYLAAHSTERDTLTIPLHLPASKVNLIAAGERVLVQLEHLPGYEADYVPIRVATKTISEAGLGADNEPMYDVVLKCTNSAPANNSGGGAPPPDTFPHQAGHARVVQTGCAGTIGGAIAVTFDSPVSVGHIIVIGIVARDGTTDPTADTDPGGAHNFVEFDVIDRVTLNGAPTTDCVLMSRIVTADDFISGPGTIYGFGTYAGTGRPNLLAWELADAGDSTAHVSMDNLVGTSFSFPALPTGAGIAIAFVGTGSDAPEPADISPHDHFYVEAGAHFWQTALGADRDVTPGSVTFTGAFTVAGGGSNHCGVVAFFPATTEPPPPGRWVYGEAVTLTGGVGTTAFPFADGSLKVRYDIVDQTAAIVSYDGSTGQFTMPSQPPLGTQVFVDYQGR